jgi:hypothetical protein
VFVLPEFQLPAYLAPRPPKSGITLVGVSSARLGGVPAETIRQRYQADQVEFSSTYTPADFARFLAKVAFGCAAAAAVQSPRHDELDRLRAASYVLPVILGTDENLGMWIGSTPPDQNTPAVPEDIRVELQEQDGNILATMRFFGRLPSPIYIVVVGRVPEG